MARVKRKKYIWYRQCESCGYKKILKNPSKAHENKSLGYIEVIDLELPPPNNIRRIDPRTIVAVRTNHIEYVYSGRD